MAASLRDFSPPMAQTPFLKGVYLTLGILVLCVGVEYFVPDGTVGFQSPYGDFGTLIPYRKCRTWRRFFRFSPLTGILVL